MTPILYYLVAWTAYACPWWMPSAAPKQILCREKKEIVAYQDWPSAVAKIREVGPGAALWQLRGNALQPVAVKWRTELEVVEEP